ncbi:hypothetical protein BBR47_55840 [Brevibacillus brevis NBRC 100599]|uniref:Uncharacterized protein n=1 Tax=Brevibacillus brevis (strain 47 / JCM 6285 / NBRC 100599) TaxID=358681 RepID=C0Z8D4_BREBN|nr:hypothetical protein BBR47_55840 [Brevibacillus brevis NBRC 100599]
MFRLLENRELSMLNEPFLKGDFTFGTKKEKGR